MWCGVFEGQLITSILGDRSQRREMTPPFQSSAAGLGHHQDLNGKEEEAEGWLRTRVRRHFQRLSPFHILHRFVTFRKLFLSDESAVYVAVEAEFAAPTFQVRSTIGSTSRYLLFSWRSGAFAHVEYLDRSLGIFVSWHRLFLMVFYLHNSRLSFRWTEFLLCKWVQVI